MKQTIAKIPGLVIHLGALWELPPEARVILLLGDRGCDHLREIARMAEFRGGSSMPRRWASSSDRPRWNRCSTRCWAGCVS
jgi:hypothetical protein